MLIMKIENRLAAVSTKGMDFSCVGQTISCLVS